MSRGLTVTRAQIARALNAAREAWGDRARVLIHPDRTITIECRDDPETPPKPQTAPGRRMVL
jgi:hypothetical protein